MRSRLGRLVAVLAVAMTVAVPSSPAKATSAFAAAFVGQMDLSGPGLGYACTNDGTTGGLPVVVDPSYLCVDSLLTDHNPHDASLSSVVCADAGVNVLKGLLVLLAEAGRCSLGWGGTIAGGCDVNSGHLSGLFIATDPVNFQSHVFVLDVHFTSAPAGTFVLTGDARDLETGQAGLVAGTGELVAPTPILTPGQSCLDLTATSFVVTARIAIVTT